eukprot:CAMPEP_0170510942 /NCGR_PEP_ID=MMETSP0208-20121228/66035_1 /TAXON_ID=197538 /ORGANISM="Strombidium inclinatum, Strain S3" /LENGTH=80 /DNA_ID=CAMNT_0010794439 /DNA_START=4430 /DNA_END=4672 /DNA_ORIENTATION=+
MKKKLIGCQGGDHLMFENLIMSRHPTQESGVKQAVYHQKTKSDMQFEKRRNKTTKQSHFEEQLKKKGNFPTLNNNVEGSK